MRYLIFIVIALSSSNAFSVECPIKNKSGQYIYYDSELAEDLRSSVTALSVKLSKINILTFSDRDDLSAVTAVSLMEEVKDTLKFMLDIEQLAEKIRVKAKCSENPDTLNEWVTIARNLAKTSGYIYDLEDFRLLDSKEKCFSCELITVRLSQVFDFIEARISNESVIK